MQKHDSPLISAWSSLLPRVTKSMTFDVKSKTTCESPCMTDTVKRSPYDARGIPPANIMYAPPLQQQGSNYRSDTPAPVWCCPLVSQFKYLQCCQIHATSWWVTMCICHFQMPITGDCNLVHCDAKKASTKPDIHDILQCCQRRMEPQPQVTCIENLVQTGWTCNMQFKHADKQTDKMLITILHSPTGAE